ncbi:hypothetical protein ACXR6G_14820 [Ancylomarina sp. YFZ004]
MKIFIKICLLLSIAWQANGQGKGFNSPDNYMGHRPQYKDTLSIDLTKGQKVEFIYQWYDLFREDEQKFEKYFWNPFDSNFKLLKEKIKDLSFEDDTKYKITLKSRFDRYNFFSILSHFHVSDSIKNFKSKTKEERKKNIKIRMDSVNKLLAQRNHVLSVTERVKPTKHREYQLENGKLVSQTQWQHILELDYQRWKVRFYLNKISDIETLSIQNIKQLIRSERSNFMKKRLYRFHTNLQYKLIEGELKQQSAYQPRRMERTRHMSLNFYPQVGTSLIKGQFSADMGALLGMNFNHKQNSAIRIAARYQLKAFGQADLNNEHSVKYNGFLDAIMDVNIAKDYKREEWVGAGFGYLIHQEGHIYGENTARIFLKYRSSKMWGIQPEFNYSFKENNGFVGLGVYFSL